MTKRLTKQFIRHGFISAAHAAWMLGLPEEQVIQLANAGVLGRETRRDARGGTWVQLEAVTSSGFYSLNHAQKIAEGFIRCILDRAAPGQDTDSPEVRSALAEIRLRAKRVQAAEPIDPEEDPDAPYRRLVAALGIVSIRRRPR